MKLRIRSLKIQLACMWLTASGVLAAQEAASGTTTEPAGIECTADRCESDEGLLFSIRSKGEHQAVSGSDAVGVSAMAPDRRATVQAEAGGKASVIGKWSVNLPNGGVVWATEDPSLGRPEFSVSAPSLVAFDGSGIVAPVKFFAYSNYSAFVQRAEILIFRSGDIDLIAPIATVPLTLGSVSEAIWDGKLSEVAGLRQGDELIYIARLYDSAGAFDETYPGRLQLVKPAVAERGLQRIGENASRGSGESVSVEEAVRLSQIDGIFGQSGLRQQNIPIYGSRIRIQGRNIPDKGTVTINGMNQPVDLERKLVAEYLVPVGSHQFDVAVAGVSEQPLNYRLDIDVSGKYLFAVAIADFTVSGSSTTDSIEPVRESDAYEDSFLLEGRLAFYLKGKIKGKYLVTAQADTQEREITELFDNFWSPDPQDIFRRLDPDAYYPVYGDDSITYRDVDTQGKLYVRVDWDKNQALWGNYFTGITGTQFGYYSRSLYGGALNWSSQRTTATGEAGSQLRAFGSDAQTAYGHSDLLGTGGSLYYLKHANILPGSDRAVLEIRDPTTGRVVRRVDMARGPDYDIDEIQGRFILTRPLSQTTRENMPTLTRELPLDGYTQVIKVDYEYVPDGGFDLDQFTGGLRAKHWFGDHVAVGATYVDENRSGEDYTLLGADLTLQKGYGTYLKVEHSETEASSVPIFYSDNGGLSFIETNPQARYRSGDATAVEARANFKELGWTDRDWAAGAWWQDVDSGFSVSRYDPGADVVEYGAEVLGQFTPDVNFYSRLTVAERDAESLSQAQVTAQWLVSDDTTWGAEIRMIEEDRLSGKSVGTLAALEYKHQVGSNLDLYGVGQLTLDDDGGAYEGNNSLTVGAEYVFGDFSTILAELVAGERGNAAKIGADYRLNQNYGIYGTYTYSSDIREYDTLFNSQLYTGWTVGQRWRISNQVNMYNESQYLKDPQESGLANTFGMDFYPGTGWNIGFTLQSAELEKSQGIVDRQAVSVSGGFVDNTMQWQSKLEWREDTGLEQLTQWVTTNKLLYRVNEDWRIGGRLNYSETEDRLDFLKGAKFVEANIGFAYRPADNTRWALLGKYTYLYDVSPFEQNGSNVADYDQNSQVLSFEGIYNPVDQWEFAAKAMGRIAEVRYGRLTGDWEASNAIFLAGQARYAFAGAWNALLEYRFLGVKDGGNLQGALLGLDYDVNSNFRIGGGYNFTDFSDDLTDFDYDDNGWFINFVGSY